MAEDASKRIRLRRPRRLAAGALLVLALIVGFAANITTWTQGVLLDTDEWVATVAELPEQPAVAEAIADLIVDELASETADNRAQAREALPPRAQFLAGPIAAAIGDLVRQEVADLIQSERFNAIWVRANTAAHRQLQAVLTGDDPDAVLVSSGGEVRLDLSEVVLAIRERLGDDADRLLGPPREGQGIVVIADSEQLSTAQSAADVLDTLGIVLPIAALLLLALGLISSTDRRRYLVFAGVGVAIIMAITLISLDVGRGELVSLIEDQTVKLAGVEAYDVLVDDLSRQTWVILFVGLIVAAGAWLAGPAGTAASIRDGVRRFALSARGAAGLDQTSQGSRVGHVVADHRGLFQFGGVAVALIVLIAWDRPGWLTVLVVALILAVWLIALEVAAPRRRGAAGA